MGHGVALVGAQADLRVHAHQIDAGTVILPGPDVVERIIIFPAQGLPALRILKNSVLERLTGCLLLLLGSGGLFFVENTGFLPIHPFFIKIRTSRWFSVASKIS